MATSMAARFWSFSRLISVITDPVAVDMYRAGTRLRAYTIASSRQTSQPQKSGKRPTSDSYETRTCSSTRLWITEPPVRA